MPLIIIASTFIAVALFTAVILYPLLSSRSVVQERLDKMGTVAVVKPELAMGAKKTRWLDFLVRAGKSIPVTPKDQSQYTRMLIAAGLKKE
ncbi:MAG TPA: type II secretion system F family protein, partial [Geobacteraceae bacterium]|nr:type II secretion system F family protein [Geobacteraceae bacterium]